MWNTNELWKYSSILKTILILHFISKTKNLAFSIVKLNQFTLQCAVKTKDYMDSIDLSQSYLWLIRRGQIVKYNEHQVVSFCSHPKQDLWEKYCKTENGIELRSSTHYKTGINCEWGTIYDEYNLGKYFEEWVAKVISLDPCFCCI